VSDATALHGVAAHGMTLVPFVSGGGLVVLAMGHLVMRIRSRSKAPKGAKWATRRDLASLHVRGPAQGRVVLGRFNGSLIAAGDWASTLVIGPTQVAGKSSRVVIPALWNGRGPC